ncbi:MAG: AAA family ATPase, partial [Acaryochloridaceae cyanobacterium RU_4_10]|nr:AAA family ATPase [Acaryochloridaceae cyanobacterium RU_4_10]
MSATDRHIIIHGLAGVGKTTALKQLKHLIEASGSNLKIRGYSPTIKAAKHLASEMGIETNTVEHLVLKTSKGASNELWIVDEAGMTSARQMEVILAKADEVGARILLVGDTNQNHSIEAGSPMKSLMKYGVTAFNIHEIIRQKDQTQKRAVELASSGRGAEALSLLHEHGWVQEIEDCNARAQAAAQEWLSLPQEERDDTLIVTGTNAERLRITECLRWGLREEGSLGEDHIFKQLVSRQFTTEEKSRAENYSKGDYIRLNWQPKTTPLQKDKLYQVVGKKEGQLLVETEGGRLYWFDPSKYKDKEVFYEKDIALAVGDRLRWRITNKPEDQINGVEFTVKAIDGNRLAVINEKGEEQSIDGSKPLGLDYALVSTAHGSQGLSKKRVIVSATSGPTSAKEPFYVKISRQKTHIVVFADNLKELRKWVSRSAAQDNPLDLIGDNYGNPNEHGPEAGFNTPAERSDSITEPGAATTESGIENLAERGNKHS